MSILKLYEYQNLKNDYLKLKRQSDNEEQREKLLNWKKQIEDSKKQREDLKRLYEEQRKELKKLNNLIKDYEIKSENLESQMYSGEITNSKELLAMQLNLDKLNEQIKEAYTLFNKKEKELKELSNIIQERKSEITLEIRRYQLETNKYKQQREINKAELGKLANKIKALTAEIDDKLLELYKKKAQKISFNVLVPLKGEKCGGCYIDVSKMLLAELKHGKASLVNCENCGRMLFIK